MTFKEELNKFKETGLSLSRLSIAAEVQAVFDTLSDTEFENICDYMEQVYFDSDSYDINEMCRNVKYYIYHNCNSIDEFIEADIDYEEVVEI